MPWLVRALLGAGLRACDGRRAARPRRRRDPARLRLDEVVPGHDRPPVLRIVAHAVESAVLLPLIVVFGKDWGVTGAGGAVLVSAIAFAASAW